MAVIYLSPLSLTISRNAKKKKESKIHFSHFVLFFMVDLLSGWAERSRLLLIIKSPVGGKKRETA